MAGNDLRGIFPPNECGLNSPHAVASAFHLISEYDLTCHLIPSPLTTGSTDKLLAAHALFGDDMETRIACRRGSVWGLLLPRDRDRAYLEKDLGKLPSRTWGTTCNGCTGAVLWFKAGLDDPDLKVGAEKLRGTSAKLCRSVAVAGSRRRRDRDVLSYDEKHQWLPHSAPWDCDLAPLPASWLFSLPAIDGGSLSAASSRHSEWCASPTSPRFTGR